MRRIWKKLIPSACEHPHTVVITSVGVRRSVCESCGHISFEMIPTDAGDRRRAKREPFSRAAGL